MLNIGLEVLNGKTKTVSTESILEGYISCENFFSNTDAMTDYADQLFTAFDNLVSLGRTASKYKSTESLAVINALVKDDFHGNFSLEAVAGYTDTVWGKIKAFFAKVWNWIKMFFQRIISLFSNTENRLAKLKGRVQEYRNNNEGIAEWRYIGLPVDKLGSIAADYTKFCNSIALLDDVAKAKEKLNETFRGTSDAPNSGMNTDASFGKSILVKNAQQSLDIIGAIEKAFAAARPLQTAAERDLAADKKKVEELSGKKEDNADAIKEAKVVMGKTNVKLRKKKRNN